MSEIPIDDASGEETVILVRLSDATEAGALRELLESEGIAVATPGLTHRGMWGIAGGFVEIVVRVAKKDLERAQELYDGLHLPSSPSGSPAAEPPDESPRTDRLRRIAVFAALWLPFGGGHFYARRHRAAFFLLGAQLVAIGLALALPLFWYAVPGIMFADGLGSVLTVGAMQRGTAPSALARYAPMLAVLSILAIPGLRFATPGLLAGSAMRSACAAAADCGGPETAAACIDRAAGGVLEGHVPGSYAVDCAECLRETSCNDAADVCGVCVLMVELPPPVEDTTHGPAGTLPSDLQIVIPDLFAPRGEGLSPAELDQIFHDLPPEPTTSSAPGPL